MNILWLETAQDDLNALTDYIAEDSPQQALQIFSTIRQSVDELAIFPSAGREGRVGQTRELVIPRLPYIAVYLVTREVQILAILHTSRKWPVAFEA